MADEVKATLCKRNGEMKVFKESIIKESIANKTNLDALVGSLMKVQKQVNEALTEIVEAQRNTSTNSSNKTTEDIDVDNEDDDENSDDDDNDDDDDGNINSSSTDLGKNNFYEPVPKKPKT